MAHDGSDGSSMSERITQAGYDWSAVAENVAAGQVDVDAVMVAWINSPEHLENIMGEYTMFAPEQCDGVTTSGSTTLQDATQDVDMVQGEAETEAPTPAPTSMTDAPSRMFLRRRLRCGPGHGCSCYGGPGHTRLDDLDPETPAQADCQSNF
ncbi:putative SCP domain-containing protein [Phytophthora infestans]|uniref:Putative SCP domain-containing protein n=1 Tax=Phytophthora infestans TaxID=4787 RepID=A0A833RUV8_PHYIN|nr:putative SCP domain-containing protein [Phytophthora infestans]